MCEHQTIACQCGPVLRSSADWRGVGGRVLRSLASEAGGFSLRPGLSIALHLAVIIILVWGVLSFTLPKGNSFAPLTLAQVNLDELFSSENPGKRTWNSKTWDLYQGNSRFKTEFHSKWINFLDEDNQWKEIRPDLREYPITDPDYYTADQLPFKVKVPRSSLGVASFESNNRYDIFEKKKIDDPPLTQTMEALEVQNVTGVLENYEGTGGVNNSVRYPLAYPQYNADLIYWIHQGKAPRLNKLIKFNLNPFVKEDVRLRFKLTFDQPTEIEAAEETPARQNPPKADLGGPANPVSAPSDNASSTIPTLPSTNPAATTTDNQTVTASLLDETADQATTATSTPDKGKNDHPKDEQKESKRKNWNKQNTIFTSQHVGIREAGAATTTQRGLSFRDFYVWDSASPSNRQPIQVELAPYRAEGSGTGFEPVPNEPNTFILTKIIPKAYLDTATYPVFTDVTTTFFPDPNVEVTSVDGYTQRLSTSGCTGTSGGDSFSSMRTGSGTQVDDTATSEQIAVISAGGCGSGLFGQFRRGIFLFDTSSIPDDNTIDSATLSLFGTAKTDNFSQSVGIVTSTPASNTSLATGDYALANFGSTDFATRITIANWSTTAYNDFALNSSGLSNISKTDVSKFGTRLSGDIDNSEPAWSAVSANIQSNFADATGTANDPKLVVTYSAGSSGAFFLLFD